MIKTKNCDILNATEDIICQSVNFQGVMGSGLAKKLVSRYPKMLDDNGNYKSIINTYNFFEVKTEGIVAVYKQDECSPFIANIYGQEKYGRNKNARYTDYISLANGLMYVASFANEHALTVAIPSHIGCGLGRGNWEFVRELIEDSFGYMDVDTTIYQLEF